MPDTRTPEQRRRIMQAVKTKDTGPEMVVRRLLHRLGYRYRLHSKSLPGHPDIVFPSRHKVIFVHGCYWHGHGCAKGKLPKSRLDYWGPKIEATVQRDLAQQERIEDLGWEVLTVWQCEAKDLVELENRLVTFLGAPGTQDAATTSHQFDRVYVHSGELRCAQLESISSQELEG